jgi:hypothetical protein
MINARDGGIGGVKLAWEECETAYKPDRFIECYERLKNKGEAGATVFQPLGNITKDEAKAQLSYEDIMLKNLEKLSKALMCN